VSDRNEGIFTYKIVVKDDNFRWGSSVDRHVYSLVYILLGKIFFR